MSRICSARAAKSTRAGLTLALGLLLSACGGFLGDTETPDPPLPGERIPLRETRSEGVVDPTVVAGLSQLPPAVALTDWTHVNGIPSHAPGHLAGPSSLRLAWSADAGYGSDDAPITAAPIVASGVAYVLDGEAVVTAISTTDGARRWEVDLAPEEEGGEDGFGGGVAFENGVIYAATGFGEIIALAATDGAELWRRRLDAPMRAAPTVENGRVFAVTRDNGAFAISAADGTILWRIQGSSGTLGLLGGASPAVTGEALILPFASGELMAVRASSGARVWAEVLSSGRRGTARSVINDITGDPVIAGQGIFAANQSGLTIAIEGRAGRRVWERRFGAVGPVWVVGETVFAVTDDARVVRLRALTGETIWETPLPAFADPDDREEAIAYAGPVVAGGKVYVSSSEEGLIVLDAVDGARRTFDDELGDGSSLPPIVVGGAVYLLSNSGRLYAFR